MLTYPVQRWTILAVSPPQPLLHCASCGVIRAFVCSDRIRLNANGKMLDAWLIFRCSSCDNTWNRTVFERRRLTDIASVELDALHHSDAEYVANIAFNSVGLPKVLSSDDVVVERDPLLDVNFMIVFSVPRPVHIRLDRLLARELRVSRSSLVGVVEPTSQLRKPLRDGLRVLIDVDREKVGAVK